MKNLKNCLSLFLFFAFTTFSIAQTTIGVRGGINLATNDVNPFENMLTDVELDKGYITGLNAAAFANFEVSEMFSIQPEVHFIQKGVKATQTEVGPDNMDVKMTYKYNFLEVPVLGRLNFTNVEETFGFNVFVGPSFGYALNGKYIGDNVTLSTEGGIEKGDFEEDLEWDESYTTDGVQDNRWDFGATAGAGIELAAGNAKVLLDARYNLGFSDKYQYENDRPDNVDAIKNRGISVTIGLAYPLW